MSEDLDRLKRFRGRILELFFAVVFGSRVRGESLRGIGI